MMDMITYPQVVCFIHPCCPTNTPECIPDVYHLSHYQVVYTLHNGMEEMLLLCQSVTAVSRYQGMNKIKQIHLPVYVGCVCRLEMLTDSFLS